MTNLKNKSLLKFLLLCLLLTPFLLKAEVSSVYNHIINTNSSSENVNTSGTTYLEVTNTTIINGERSEYHYATSSNGSIKRDVIIINNSPNESKIISVAFGTGTENSKDTFDYKKLPEASTDSKTIQTSSKLWSEIENVLNYLYFYVEQLF